MSMYQAYDKNTGHPLPVGTVTLPTSYSDTAKELVLEKLKEMFPDADPDLLDMLESGE